MKRINKSKCRECGGRCCKKIPGVVHPKDIDLDKAVKSGLYAIDWWEGDPRLNRNELDVCYYIRPKIKGVKTLFDPSWGGECTFLGKKGCVLSFRERPFECRNLIPGKRNIGGTFECYDSIGRTKRNFSMLWIEHQTTLESYLETE